MAGRSDLVMAIPIMAAAITVLSTDLTTVMAGVDTMIHSSMIHGMLGVRAGAGVVLIGWVTTMATGMAITMAAGDIRIMVVQEDITATEAAWLADRHIHREAQEVLEMETIRKIPMLVVAERAVDLPQPAEVLLLIKPLRQEVVIADIPEVLLNKKPLPIVRPGQKDLLTE
jgi:hypothetical protein